MHFFPGAITPAAQKGFMGWMQICVKLCGVPERCFSFPKENENPSKQEVLFTLWLLSQKHTPKNCSHFTT